MCSAGGLILPILGWGTKTCSITVFLFPNPNTSDPTNELTGESLLKETGRVMQRKR